MTQPAAPATPIPRGWSRFRVRVRIVRWVAWTAAETTGFALVSQGLANHVLSNLPMIKRVAGALPETGAVATRLYRLAGVTAETCCPVSS